jgi:plastocyanin
MRRMAVVVVSIVLVLGACGSGGGSSERQVLVDYSSDEFANFVAQDFPNKLEITPGQTVVWKQTWTGEPHTVTGGALVTAKLSKTKNLLQLFDGYTSLVSTNHDLIDPENAGDATMVDFFAALRHAKPAAKRDAVMAAWRGVQKEHPELPDIDHPPATPVSAMNDQVNQIADDAFNDLPSAHDDSGVAQNVGQRCFLRTGAPPQETSQACTAAQQRQPVFDGKYSFYNSGVLPYQGPRGNTYRVKFAGTTKPGTYLFFCAVHGPQQTTEVVVRPKGTKVPSASAIARLGRKQANDVITPLAKTFRTTSRTGKLSWHGEKLSEPFAGLPSDIEASINEFVPRTIHAKVDQPITWNVIGADHTISFNVPPYLPIFNFRSDGKVVFNPKVDNPTGGAPTIPDAGDEGQPRKIDGGTYDGTGFWSSGTVGGDPARQYTLRISKPGTYNYACLVHPRMIGKVVVS